MPRKSVLGLGRKTSSVARLSLPQDLAEELGKLPVEKRNAILRASIALLVKTQPTSQEEVAAMIDGLSSDLEHHKEAGELPEECSWERKQQ